MRGCSPHRPASRCLASALRSAVSSNLWCPLQCLRDDPAGLLHRENRPASPQVWPSPPRPAPAPPQLHRSSAPPALFPPRAVCFWCPSLIFPSVESSPSGSNSVFPTLRHSSKTSLDASTQLEAALAFPAPCRTLQSIPPPSPALPPPAVPWSASCLFPWPSSAHVASLSSPEVALH